MAASYFERNLFLEGASGNKHKMNTKSSHVEKERRKKIIIIIPQSCTCWDYGWMAVTFMLRREFENKLRELSVKPLENVNIFISTKISPININML